MYNTGSELEGTPRALGDNDVSVCIHQLQQMYYPGGDADNEGGHMCVEKGSVQEPSILSAQFCCEPKTALKNKVCYRGGGKSISSFTRKEKMAGARKHVQNERWKGT